jgi:hypothetical protein
MLWRPLVRHYYGMWPKYFFATDPRKVKAVRQKATEFDLDFVDNSTAKITLAAETSSVMLRNKAGELEYAD